MLTENIFCSAHESQDGVSSIPFNDASPIPVAMYIHLYIFTYIYIRIDWPNFEIHVMFM